MVFLPWKYSFGEHVILPSAMHLPSPSLIYPFLLLKLGNAELIAKEYSNPLEIQLHLYQMETGEQHQHHVHLKDHRV